LKDEDNQPEGLKPSQEKAEQLAKKMAGSFMKIMPYMGDTEVQAAQKRFSKAMHTIM